MKKLLKELLILSIISVTMLVMILVVRFHSHLIEFFLSLEEKYFYRQLVLFKESGAGSIDLKNLTNFEWDTVCAEGTYSPTENPSSSLKFYIGGYATKKIDIHGSQFNKLTNQKGYVSFAGGMRCSDVKQWSKCDYFGNDFELKEAHLTIVQKEIYDKPHYVIQIVRK